MKKYFIFAPSNAITGGQECLHQLCDALNSKGKNAFIIYYPNPNSNIPEVYKKYNIKVSSRVEDSNSNIVILHESQFDRLFDIKHATVLFWWLSVDNFFKSSMRYLKLYDYIKYRPRYLFKAIAVKLYYLLIRKKNILFKQLSLNELKLKSKFHFCQSVYSEKFLYKEGFNNLYQLNDYINSEFKLEASLIRDNIILYNPKKGLKFQKFLINKFPEFKWVPIINMNYSQIANLMNRSKVYVDFGNHPGRDKIPREAVAAGLCIITGMRGSALYHGDIPIPENFKFNQFDFDINKFRNIINEIFLNYENEYSKFNEYREFVLQSEINFQNQVDFYLQNKIL